MPVLPEVASSRVLSWVRRPDRSPSRIMLEPARSFTEPPGLKNSALAWISTPGNSESSFFRRIRGVLPIWSSSEDAGAATDLGRAGAILDTSIVPNHGQHHADFRHLLVSLTSGDLDPMAT